MQPAFEVFRDKAGEWRWRLRARNGEVIAQSEAYTRSGDAVSGVMDCRIAAKEAIQVKDDEIEGR